MTEENGKKIGWLLKTANQAVQLLFPVFTLFVGWIANETMANTREIAVGNERMYTKDMAREEIQSIRNLLYEVRMGAADKADIAGIRTELSQLHQELGQVSAKLDKAM